MSALTTFPASIAIQTWAVLVLACLTLLPTNGPKVDAAGALLAAMQVQVSAGLPLYLWARAAVSRLPAATHAQAGATHVATQGSHGSGQPQ